MRQTRERAREAAGERLAALARRIEAGVTAADRLRLAARLRRLERARRPDPRALAALEAEVAEAEARRAARAARIPRPDYPQDLPVVRHCEAILEALRAHQVVVVCGETGSGKSTQLPKLCLELGRGAAGLVGHTQPRRIAARSLATRLAAELGSEPGRLVGWQVRFHDRTGPDTLIKVMTDGILLAETQADPLLARYDTIILDEAHERSLNIDFLLGYLKRILPRRPDLKVVVTSATLDARRFAEHFGGAPVLEIPGRSHPVEVRYRPLAERDEPDLAEAVADAVAELCREGPGDVLVFLPGEREIRECAEVLRRRHPPGTEILPLYARLSVREQQRVFAPSGGRRVVLATNVAETSLTVPGIRYVVDSGLVRMARYSARSGIQRLPVEPVSQASAEQRAGRCGRLGPGVCIRLYAEADYAARPRWTDPEIRRANLAAVVLRMAALGLGEPERFPFLEPPDPRHLRNARRTLHELGALDAEGRLTALGGRLARLPVDPRIGRMVLEAERQGALREVLVIAAALSVQDPRERPAEARQAADEAHRRFFDHPRSDFMGFLRLWEAYHEALRHLSNRKLRAWCREHFLSYLRLRDWHDVHAQLHELVKGMGLRENTEPADYGAIHRSLLAGLLGHVAMHVEDGLYQGARGMKLRIHPGSGLARRRPAWIVAAELAETTRLYARTVAAIDPRWIEPLARHLVRRRHEEPRWNARAGRADCTEIVTLWGLPVGRRRADYARLDPAGARALLVREGLVHGRLPRRPAVIERNLALLAELRALEQRTRRGGLVVPEEAVARLYEARLPEEVTDSRRLERWLREAGPEAEARLALRREDLLAGEPDADTAGRFPERLRARGIELALRYRFEPGAENDGVTARVPLAALNALEPAWFEWLVPGLLEEKATALIRSLPKGLRRHLVPAPDFARAAVQALGTAPRPEPFAAALARELARMTGVPLRAEDFRPEALPAHLHMRFEVVDGEGAVVAAGRDLAALQAAHGASARAAFAQAAGAGLERTGLRDWDFGELPAEVAVERDGVRVTGFPALVEEGGKAALRVLDSPEAAARAMPAGLTRLYMARLRDLARRLARDAADPAMALRYAALAPGRDLADELVFAAFRAVLVDGRPWPRDRAAFEAALAGRDRLAETLAQLREWVGETLERWQAVQRRLKGPLPPRRLESLRDVQAHLARLVFPGFVRGVPAARLRHYPRYLRAVERRLEKLERDPARDARWLAELRPVWRELLARLPEDPAAPLPEGLEAARWLAEELRVSLFAQELGTAEPVSLKRLRERLAAA